MIHNDALLKNGFDADIDLEEKRAEEPPHTSIYLWLPTADHTPPSQDQLHVGVSALTEIVARNLKVYVHCKNGHGRAPTLVGAYLMTHGYDLEGAIAFMQSKRPEIHLQQSQKEALDIF